MGFQIAIYILACVFVKIQGLTDEQKELLKRIKVECILETGVNIYNVKRLENGDWNVRHSQDPRMRNFAHCLLVKTELLSENGVVRMDMALSKVPVHDRTELTKLIDECISAEDDKPRKDISPYETAWNYLKCYHQKGPKHALM